VARSLPLEITCRSGDLLGHGCIGLVHRFVPTDCDRPASPNTKKADVVEQLIDHGGLLVNRPPGTAELPFI
jgi:hypothetical protein